MFAIAVHGGAGAWDPDAHEGALAGVRRALDHGHRQLADGAPALDAVTEAARLLEDDPLFNAGTGSALGLDGAVECDAAVMVGAGFRTGAVAAVRNVKNAVLLARRVMEETDHVLLAGEGAEALAEVWGLKTGNEPTEARRRKWQAAREKLGLEDGPPDTARLAALLRAHPELAAARRGTIGVVARDAQGGTAAATSTGGVLLKLPGRIGDTPVPGAGNYATPAGAASATGRGEIILRALTTKVACDLMAQGFTADAAARTAVVRTAREAGSDLGLITIDLWGGVGIAHATPWMPHGWRVDRQDPVVRMRLP